MEKELLTLKEHLVNSRNGTAVLFTGAGFSFGSKNLNQRTPVNSINLSHELCKIAEIEKDDDLYYSSEKCIKSGKTNALISFLKNEFTVTEVAPHHKIIADKKWRRIYTTNYDKAFEIASNQIGKSCESISISTNPSDNTQLNQCIHLNGCIDSLNTANLNSEFKLSDSSYVSPDTINNSHWKSIFQLEIEYASAIFFVGYSLYDLDIKRVIKVDEDIKGKTFFIVKKDESEKEIFKLSEYGTVLAIGIEEFSKIIEATITSPPVSDFRNLESFTKVSNKPSKDDITDKEIISLLAKGEIIDSQIFPSTIKSTNYLIKRETIESHTNLIKSNNNLLITGDIASGKSIYLRQLSSALTNQGIDVFFLDKEEGDYKRDIPIISDLSDSPIFVIDNAFRHEEIIKNLYSYFKGRASFIVGGRTDFIERTKLKLATIGVKFIEDETGKLSDDEIVDFNKICNFIGVWGERNSLPDHRKETYLKEKLEGSFSSILLEFFDSEQIKKKFEEAFAALSDKNNRYRDIIFTVVTLEILPFSPRKSLISEICKNNRIYEPDFLESAICRGILTFSRGNVNVKSGILAKYILTRFFSGHEIVEKVIQLISHFHTIRNYSAINNSVFKELLRFKNINFMLSDENRGKNLILFFDKVKAIIPWMEKSPHYWLQHGMANMFIGNYSRAKTSFDTAYGSAKNDPHYDTQYIDNQVARWHLEFGLQKNTATESLEHFIAAFRILMRTDIDYYFAKQAMLVESYYQNIYPIMSKSQKVDFEKHCKNISKKFESQKAYTETHNGAYVADCNATINCIIEEIKLSRS